MLSRRGVKKTLLFICAFFALLLMSCWAIGGFLLRSANEPVVMPPEFENVVVAGTHGSVLRATRSDMCALLMHGIRSNRSSMIKRARFLQQHNISSLAVDLQAHGETPGSTISFGIRESQDARNGLH